MDGLPIRKVQYNMGSVGLFCMLGLGRGGGPVVTGLALSPGLVQIDQFACVMGFIFQFGRAIQ